MKDGFFAFRKYDEPILTHIWHNALISIDTNMLLNTYKLSPAGREQFINLLQRLQDRLWLPHQVVKEFHRNRKETILEQIEAPQKMKQTLNLPLKQLIEKIETSTVRFRDDITDQLQDGLKEAQNKINDILSTYPHRLIKSNFFDDKFDLNKDDFILDQLSSIIATDKIGPEFNNQNLFQLYEEGERRYQLKIPPGFEDANTKKDYRKFGDLIIWKQMMEKAREEDVKRPFIFITEDVKPDWWQKENNWKQPHPELLFEFYKETNQYIMIYTYEEFVEAANSFIANLPPTDTAVEEMRNIADELRVVEEDEAGVLEFGRGLHPGDVFLTNFEDTIRPVIIIRVNDTSILAAPITTRRLRGKYDVEVIIQENTVVARINRVTLINKKNLGVYLETLDDMTLSRIEQTLANFFLRDKPEI